MFRHPSPTTTATHFNSQEKAGTHLSGAAKPWCKPLCGFVWVSSGTPRSTAPPPSTMHGNPQPPARKKPTRAVFATYLFMKCEVMKKVLNPTTVLTLTVLSRSAGPGGAVPASTPGCPPVRHSQGF